VFIIYIFHIVLGICKTISNFLYFIFKKIGTLRHIFRCYENLPNYNSPNTQYAKILVRQIYIFTKYKIRRIFVNTKFANENIFDEKKPIAGKIFKFLLNFLGENY